MAGLSVAATVVPQGISYAGLAGLPSVFGLYGAFVPVWMYAALGSSKHLVCGEHQQCSFPAMSTCTQHRPPSSHIITNPGGWSSGRDVHVAVFWHQ